MKKSIVLMLSGLMVLGLAACKEKSADAAAAGDAKACHSEGGGKASGSLAKDYEKFVDEYVALAKKAKTGDLAAVQELQKLAQKMQDWSTKLSSATEADAKEIERINEKMVEALK